MGYKGLMTKADKDILANFGRFSDGITKERSIAVAVSGGPDSMALCGLLSVWAKSERPDLKIHAITVDHRLRPESGTEAKSVGKTLKIFPNITHRILVWAHDETPSSRVQETARQARYDLIYTYMKKEGLKHLFLGHHQDDQAETVLFRLAKGSGLDGLSGMEPYQETEEGIVLCRPLLSAAKDGLVAYCQNNNILFHNDPSNEADRFARVRMRRSMDILAQEGLTAKRLSVTARRVSRARKALEELSKNSLNQSILEKDTNRLVLKLSVIQNCPEEIGLRVVLRAMEILVPSENYGPRLERVEELFSDLMKPDAFRKRTLSGIIFDRKDKTDQLFLVREQ